MKNKKMMALITAAAMAMGLAGCGGGNTAATTAAPTEKAEGTTAAEAVTEATEAAKPEGTDNWKVAILTGTVSQGEEEFRAAERALADLRTGAHRDRHLSGQLHVRDGDHRIPDRILRI